eukprot:4810116-Alexandrium_andersonii.AAC.1
MSLVERVGMSEDVFGEPYCAQPLARGVTVPAFKARGPVRATEDAGSTLWAAPKRSDAARQTMGLLDRAAMRL